jgi:hypothetical protein
MRLDDFDAVVACRCGAFRHGPGAGSDREPAPHLPGGQMVLDLDGRIVASSSA